MGWWPGKGVAWRWRCGDGSTEGAETRAGAAVYNRGVGRSEPTINEQYVCVHVQA